MGKEGEGGLIKKVKAFLKTYFPCSGGPVKFVFNDMVLEVGDDKGHAGSDLNGVSVNAGKIFSEDVVWVWVTVNGCGS